MFCQIWREYDTDGSGYIEADELKVKKFINVYIKAEAESNCVCFRKVLCPLAISADFTQHKPKIEADICGPEKTNYIYLFSELSQGPIEGSQEDQ